MNSEWEAFHAHLDANPGDSVCRMAMADWLDEHDRPEDAEAYRVLGTYGIWPTKTQGYRGMYWYHIPERIGLHWLTKCREIYKYDSFTSRRDAEAAMIAAWKTFNPECKKAVLVVFEKRFKREGMP